MCCFKFGAVVNLWWQTSQEKGLNFVERSVSSIPSSFNCWWRFRCLYRYRSWQNCFPQMWQVAVNTSLWMDRCRSRSCVHLYLLSQSGQGNGRLSLWVNMWRCRMLVWLNFRPQMWHGIWSDVLCMIMWCFNSNPDTNFLSHMVQGNWRSFMCRFRCLARLLFSSLPQRSHLYGFLP